MPGPFGAFDTMRGTPNPFGAFGRPRPQPLPVEEEEGLLSRMGSGALSGLAWLGSTLDKTFGGRAIRGALGGKPEELLSIIPFSDSLGITNPANVVTGAELLGNKDASLLSGEGVAGLGAEILLDPATYLSFGGSALTKLGRGARKAGVLPKGGAARAAGLSMGPEAESLARVAGGLQDFTGPMSPSAVAEVAGKPLGGHVGIGFPFGENLKTWDLTGAPEAIGRAVSKVPIVGPMASSLGGLARSGASKAWEKVLGPLFHKPLGGQTDAGLQDLYQTQIHEKIPEAQRLARQSVRPLAEEAELLGLMTKDGMDPQMARQLRDWVENVAPTPQQYDPFVSKIRTAMEENLLAKQGAGLVAPSLKAQTILSGPGKGNPLGYIPRQLPENLNDNAQKLMGAKPFAPGMDKARMEVFEGLPTSRINDFFNEDMTGLAKADLEAKVATDYLGMSPTYQADLQTLKSETKARAAAKGAVEGGFVKPNSPDYATAKALADEHDQFSARLDELETRTIQAKNLASWKEKVGVLGQEMFPNNPLDDIFHKQMRDNQKIVKAKALHEGITRFANPIGNIQGEAVPLRPWLEKVNMMPGGEPMQRTMQAWEKKSGQLDPGINNMYLPKKEADAMEKFLAASQTPAGLKPIVDIFDSMTNLTKAWQTVLWPANWVRNQITAVFQHWVHGISDPTASGISAYTKPWNDAAAIRRGELLKDADKIPGLQNLSNAEANKALMREIIDHDVTHLRGKSATEIAGGSPGLPRAEELLPGRQQPGLLETYKQGFKSGGYKPWEVYGFNDRKDDVFAPIRGGRKLSIALDDQNRIGTYIARRRQGYSPEAALQSVYEVHYDYGNLTGFERDVARRIAPFYSWSKQNVPAVLYEMLSKPGGKVAQSLRATTRARGDEPGFIPPFIGSGVALPMGGKDEKGTQRYLSRLGLPFEDLGELLTGGGPLGMLNPIIKQPVEAATGKQLYSGRDLDDLYSYLSEASGANLRPMEQLVMNSPGGRVMTSLRTATDPRKDLGTKALNLLTGFKMTDVDTEKAKDVAIRELIEDRLRGEPGVGRFERMYVSPENMPQLSQAEMDLYRLYQSRESARRRRR